MQCSTKISIMTLEMGISVTICHICNNERTDAPVMMSQQMVSASAEWWWHVPFACFAICRWFHQIRINASSFNIHGCTRWWTAACLTRYQCIYCSQPEMRHQYRNIGAWHRKVSRSYGCRVILMEAICIASADVCVSVYLVENRPALIMYRQHQDQNLAEHPL